MTLRNKLMLAGLMLICSAKIMGMQGGEETSINVVQAKVIGVARETLEEIRGSLCNLITAVNGEDLLDELFRVAWNCQEQLSDDSVDQLGRNGFANIGIPYLGDELDVTTLIHGDGTMLTEGKIIIRFFLPDLPSGCDFNIGDLDSLRAISRGERIFVGNLLLKQVSSGGSTEFLIITLLDARTNIPIW